MKRVFYLIKFLFVVLVFISPIYLPQCLFSDSYYFKEKDILHIMLSNIYAMHYSPKPLNEKFAENLVQAFIKQLDPGKQFFFKEDIDALKGYSSLLSQQNGILSFQFFTDAIQRYFNRIDMLKKVYPDILCSPFDFSANESIELNPDKREYAADSNEFKENWRKQLKYNTLLTYFNLVGDLSDKKALHEDPVIEADSRKKVEKNMRLMIERIEQNKKRLINTYINTIALMYDPHTSYFPVDEKENFDISMSGTLEGIGAVLTDEDGFIKVTSIVPGSAAYLEKELGVGDLILKVAEGKGEAVDVVTMPVQDAVKLIRGKKGTEVRLTVKKPDGRIIIIPIIRDVVIIEETYAKSCVIHFKNSKASYGYIVLPKFYRDFSNQLARNSTDDIEKALNLLKKEKIDGIILDLRNNGGGSLRDAVDIAGLFIEKGPVVQVKDRYDKVTVLEDTDSRVVYQGPLIILINQLSASATEILTAALQDYKRAIIVGTPSFGKGSVQTFIDLDQYKRFSYLSDLGSLKLTIQQFFRINGEAIQQNGIQPDFVLPDSNSYIDIGEKFLPNSLAFSTVNMAEYIPCPIKGVANRLSDLKRISSVRVEKNSFFKHMLIYGQMLKHQQDQVTQSLHYSRAVEQQAILKAEYQKLQKLQKGNSDIIITLPGKVRKLNPTTQDWISSIKKDLYIDESIHILNDIYSTRNEN